MADKKVSLSEVMGSKGAAAGAGASLKQLPEILGEGMPELDLSNVGRIRLIRALKQRFGSNFRSLPGLKNIVKEFDDRAKLAVTTEKIRAVKMKKGE
jgi:hypothetical protein